MNDPRIPYKDKTPTLLDIERTHILFTNAHFKLRFDIPSLELLENKPILQQIYIDLMYLTTEAFYYGCKGITRIPELDSMTGPEWDAEIKYALQCMLRSSEDKAEDFGFPSVVLRKYNKWTNTYTDLLRDNVTQISNSPIYDDSILRTNIFLLIMNLMIITMVGDLEKVARDITEDMAGVVYRGRELEV